ncbi:MAG: hypothetical protein U9R19_02630 [Bacteroidota bacterium]|nr:hypothetical protein [Bacteroidota bacterium]
MKARHVKAQGAAQRNPVKIQQNENKGPIASGETGESPACLHCVGIALTDTVVNSKFILIFFNIILIFIFVEQKEGFSRFIEPESI